jgi:HEAT repeat protein
MSARLAAVQARLDSPDAAVRLIALRDAADACTPDLLPAIDRALGDAEDMVRLEAVIALDAIGGAESVPLLIRALADTAPAIRELAARTLAENQAPAGAEALLAALACTSDAWAIAALLDALKPLRTGNAAPPALRLLAHADATVRAAAVGVIGYLRLPQALPELAQLSAGDTAAAVRLVALRALAWGPAETSAPTALVALGDAEWPIRAEAATILGRLGYLAAADALIGPLETDAHWQVREQAVAALGLLRYRPAVAPIGRCLQDPVSNLRRTAVIALGQIGERSVRLLLATVRNDADAQVRKLTEQLLNRLEIDSDGA